MSDIDNILRAIKPRVSSWIANEITAASTTQTNDHGKLIGLADDDHLQYIHNTSARQIYAQHTFAPAAPAAPFALNANAQNQVVTGLLADSVNKSVSAGNGLTGGGALTGNITLTVGQGAGLTVGTDDVALTTPGTLSVSSSNSSSGSHTHAITTSANPGAAASILASDASGYLTLVRLKADTLADRSGANLVISPAGDVIFDPTGNDILPNTNYDLSIGSLSKKYLTLHAAELWVETLVAQNTIATIGGRVLVGPTTVLTSDLTDSQTNLISNPGFETSGGGGADVFANWTESAGDGAIAKDTVVYQEGAASCKLTAGASFNTYVYQAFSVTANTPYSIEFWTRGDGTLAGRYGVYDVTHSTWLVAITATGVTAATWTRFTTYVVPTTGTTQLRIYFYCPDTTILATAHFDAVTISQNTIVVKHNEMAKDDIAYLEADGKVEFLWIESAPSGGGPYTYYVFRDYDDTGLNVWYAGDAVFNTGTTSEGFIDLYSYRSVKSATQYGPTIVGNVRDSLVFNGWSEHWAIGNLNGLYGYGANTYGAGFGKYVASQPNIVIDATNGLRIRSYTTNVMHFKTDGSAEISGTLLAGGGNIKIGSVGIHIISSDGYSDTRALVFLNSTGAYEIADIHGRDQTGSNLLFAGASNANQDKGATVQLRATSYSTKEALVEFDANTGGSSGLLRLRKVDSSTRAEVVFWATDLKRYEGGTTYTGGLFIPLTSPLTSTSWDGDSYSTTTKTLIDLSSVFGAPAGIKAVLVRITAWDSGSAAGTNIHIMLAPNNSSNVGALCTWLDGVPNDHYSDATGPVPCDANGDIYYQINASGSSTFDVVLQIWGYWI